MTESAAVQLRSLRAAIASGQVAPSQWEAGVFPIRSALGQRLNTILHPAPLYGCRCDDREWVLAGLDRLIAEMGAEEVQHAGE